MGTAHQQQPAQKLPHPIPNTPPGTSTAGKEDKVMDEFSNEAERQRTEEWWAELHQTQLERATYVHLTLTGQHAGYPICGIDKQQAKEMGDTFAHATYAPLDNPTIPFCPYCLDIWNGENENQP